jgi:hypothetical protein
MCGVGKTTAATRVARRLDMWLYPIDSRMLAHAEALESAALEMTLDEQWLERSPERTADDFELDARRSPLECRVACAIVGSLLACQPREVAEHDRLGWSQPCRPGNCQALLKVRFGLRVLSAPERHASAGIV